MTKIHSSIQWNKYPMFFPLVFFCIGLLIYIKEIFFSSKDFLFITNFFIVLVLLFVALQFKQSLKKQIQFLRWLTICLLFLGLGWIISFFHDPKSHSNWIGNVSTKAEAWQGIIKYEPSVKNKVIILDVEVQSYFDGVNWRVSTGNLTTIVFKNDSMKNYNLGDKIVVPNKIARIKNSNNPFSFNQANYASIQNKYHQIFLPDEEIFKYTSTSNTISWIKNVHKNIHKIIYENVNDSTTAGLISAIILNERANMDRELWEDYSRTGVAHIIAISGMHITLFFVIVGYLLFFIKHRKYQWVKYVIMIPIAWIYIALTGFPPSAVRAGVMFTLLSIANYKRREGFAINILFTSAFIILLTYPKWLLDVGFQLSFLSVLSILIFFKPISSWLELKSVVLKWIWNTLAVSIAVQILLTPLLMYYFNQFPLFSIIANLPAAIYSTVFMIGSLCIIIFGSLGVHMDFLGDFLKKLTHAFNYLINKLAQLSPEGFFQLYVTEAEFILIFILIIILSAIFLLKKRSLIIYLIPVLITLFGVLISETIKRNKQSHLVVYQINGKSLIEKIDGRNSKVFQSNNFEEADKKYTLRSAHIGWGIKNVIMEPIKMDLIKSNASNYLILNHSLPVDWNEISLKIDKIIITNSTYFDPVKWKQTINPQLVILDGSIPRYKAHKYIDELKNQKMDYHWVLEDGAFIDSN